MISTIVTVLVLVVSIVAAMSFLRRKNQLNVKDQTVIVTGGSQGLGLSVAKQLAAKGANVVIVAQTIPKLKAAVEEIKSAARDTQRFHYLSYDLRSPESGPKIIEEVTKWNNGQPPDIVFNCAGHCEPGFFASSSIEQHRNQMDTVYWTSAYMAHATLKAWTKPSPRIDRTRHLVFTSSCLALFPVAGYASYNPGKAAMRSLADTLNQEVEVYNGAWSNKSQEGPAAEIKVRPNSRASPRDNLLC
jgi:3-dehydrosphinganine reductase